MKTSLVLRATSLLATRQRTQREDFRYSIGIRSHRIAMQLHQTYRGKRTVDKIISDAKWDNGVIRAATSGKQRDYGEGKLIARF